MLMLKNKNKRVRVNLVFIDPSLAALIPGPLINHKYVYIYKARNVHPNVDLFFLTKYSSTVSDKN